jgi:hypothetical protein
MGGLPCLWEINRPQELELLDRYEGRHNFIDNATQTRVFPGLQRL